ncbi:MAG: HIG1 domain-containing protein [Rhodospirillales bacterium]|nr:HIG1 domain-containing protein [Rhodospirillales bacterium]MBO6785285.1 HIG1 domain-containing protein [Rhodospirillales bacterium]
MSSFLPFLMGFAMFATLVILVVGLVGFARNGPFYKKHANNLMRARVIGQGVALIIFALIMFLAAR